MHKLNEHLVCTLSAGLSAGLLAAHWHQGQMYGNKPYMYHLREVCKRVSAIDTLSSDDRILAQMVAYLHDILEDTECTENDIRTSLAGYPRMNDLIDAVRAITKIPSETKADYIQRVRANEIALVVKVADTLANLTESALHQPNKKRVEKYTAQLKELCK